MTRRTIWPPILTLLVVCNVGCSPKLTVVGGPAVDGAPAGAEVGAAVATVDANFGFQVPDGAPSAALDVAGACVNLQCRQQACPGGGTTSLSGTVYAPNGTLPLYNVAVYIPNAPLDPLIQGSSCERCGTLASGRPIASALSDHEGKFKLRNVPVGKDVPLVFQVGKWRRKVIIPEVLPCQENALVDPQVTRLPRNRDEGDLPRVAITQGGCDDLLCLLPKLGVDLAETGVAGQDRAFIHYDGGRIYLPGAAPAVTLWRSFEEPLLDQVARGQRGHLFREGADPQEFPCRKNAGNVGGSCSRGDEGRDETTAQTTCPVKPLAGRRVALPAARELERLTALFREEGATPVPCRLMSIADAPDPAPVDAFLRALAVGAFDDLILLTGEGLRRLWARAQRIGRGKAVRAALGRVRKITRGPKPALALHELGLAPDLPASLPTTEGVIEALALEPLLGRRIGVQLCGGDPNEPLISFLSRGGAAVHAVSPYVYLPAPDDAAVRALIEEIGAGTIHAVAFTNAAQVTCLHAAAARLGLTEELEAGLGRTLVVAVGPTTAAQLRSRGIDPQVTPRPFVMKRLAATVAAALGSDPRLQVEAGGRLRGRRIAIPEHRELDRLAKMLEEEGATTVRCPLMAIFDAPDPGPIDEWVRALAAGRFDDVIFFTGEGVRRLLESAARLGITDEVLAGLMRARKITRGPKPARALHERGVRIDLPSPVPTTAGVIDVLRAEPLAGRTVGVQLYGEDPNRVLVDFLIEKGAVVLPVAPYRYAPATHDEKVASLIDELAAGLLDGIAFTTAVQIERLFQVARRRGAEESLRRGLGQVHVAAVGPVVIDAMQRLGLRADSVPARGFFMRRLTQEMAARLGPKA